ncbi:radical SAM protein [Bacillus cereus]|nr:radical SAM protein [Bacillus cereus]
MHLKEILTLRVQPAAGVYMSLTRRCPLSCEHCSTNSSLNSEEHPEEMFYRFIKTFTPDNKPNILFLTGGEALLRPKLVIELTELAHSVGTAVCLISGMFFAKQNEIPSIISRAIDGVDLFLASLDFYHEKQVSRMAVFRTLTQLLDQGKDVGIQAVGLNEQDPYLEDLITDVIKNFGTRVPLLISQVGAIGRASDWKDIDKRPINSDIDNEPNPCIVSSWPVIGFDGTITACCNQKVIDGPPPQHLRIGHAAIDNWEKVRSHFMNSSILRAIRLFGPQYLANQYDSKGATCDGYCSTCKKFSESPEVVQKVNSFMARPTMDLIEEKILQLQQEDLRYGIEKYTHLTELGYKCN